MQGCGCLLCKLGVDGRETEPQQYQNWSNEAIHHLVKGQLRIVQYVAIFHSGLIALSAAIVLQEKTGVLFNTKYIYTKYSQFLAQRSPDTSNFLRGYDNQFLFF